MQQRAAADPAGQDRQRQLLPADAGGYSAGAAGPWCAAGVQRDRRSGAAPDQLRPGEACVPQVPAPQCGVTDRVRLREQEVPNHE